MREIEVPGHDIVGIRADNPGPFTLSGTNSWVVGRDPAWLIDPGPALQEHIEALVQSLKRRGGLAGVILTHKHADHTEATAAVRGCFPDVPVAAAGGRVEIALADGGTVGVDIALADGDKIGPLVVVSTSGHAPDHLAFVIGTAAMTGDAVLGEGSVFIAPTPGALAGYLKGLERLRSLGLDVLCPGHGPLVLDPAAKLDEYLSHRLDRERRLLAALSSGKRGVEELLDHAWADVPAELRGAAAITLAAHLDKLADEGRLPLDVERPATKLYDGAP